MGTIKIQASNIRKITLKKDISFAETITEQAGYIVKEATHGNLQLHAKGSINLHSEAGIRHEGYNPIQPQPIYEEVTTMQLQSTFAINQLQLMAKKDSRILFRHHIKKSYGTYFTKNAIDALYKDAQNAAVINPKIKVVRFISPPNAGGAYNNDTQHILVSQKLIEQALTDNDKMGELLVVLVEEFGAHINWLLRNQYTLGSDKAKLKPRKFTQVDKGAKFASFLLHFNFLETQNQSFATLTQTTTHYENKAKTASSDTTKTLVWDYQDIHTQLNAYVSKTRQNTSDVAGSYNFYKAGKLEGDDKYGHQDIEEEALTPVLIDLKVTDTEKIKEILDKIYFGNWLRDFSQVIDPGMVRPMGDTIIAYSKEKGVGTDPRLTARQKAQQQTCQNLKTVNERIQAKLGIDPCDPQLTEAQKKDVAARRKQYLDEINTTRHVKLPIDYQIKNPDATLKEPSTWIDPKIIYTEVPLRAVTFSRETLTRFVQLLAVKEFLHFKEDKKGTKEDKKEKAKENYFNLLETFKEKYLEITPKVLGVYRPEEHIDNPKSKSSKAEAPGLNYDTENPDKPFKPSPDDMGFVGDPKPKELEINKAFGMKNYIRNNQGIQLSTGRTAYQYVLYKIEQACQPNANLDNIEPMMHFGAALHVMEDYFAHSNFAEISAAKVSGNDRVFPWVDKVTYQNNIHFDYDKFAKLTPKAAQTYLNSNPKAALVDKAAVKLDSNAVKGYNDIARFIPLVTGTFGELDMAASLMPILEKQFSIEIEDYSRIDAGQRTFNDTFIREVLTELDESQDIDGSGTKDTTYVETFESLLKLRDYYSDAKLVIPRPLREAFHKFMEYVGAAFNYSIYMMLRALGGKIADAQLLLQEQVLHAEKGTVSIGTDPTHTQIAKDDDRKPLHELSAILAKHVVRHMGTKMFKYWRKPTPAIKQDMLKAIDTLFRHPAASSWQDKIVKEWCNTHKHLLCKASTPSVVIDSIIHGIEEMNEFTAKLIKISKNDKNETTLLESVLETYDKEEYLINQYKKLLNDGKKLLERAEKLSYEKYDKYYRPYYCPEPVKHNH